MIDSFPNKESGNALWFILLAVALMAALTAIVSRSSDTAEQSGNFERFRIQASDMMRYSANIVQAIDNMRMRGVGESQVSFENYSTSADYTNANAAGCADCLVFGSAGGGGSYRIPPEDWLDTSFTGDTNYGEWEFSGTNNIPDIRSANPELIMYMGYLKDGLCAQINIMLNIAGGVPVDADGFDATAFQGAFAASDTIDGMDGIEVGCFEDGGGGSSDRGNVFYQVLVKR